MLRSSFLVGALVTALVLPTPVLAAGPVIPAKVLAVAEPTEAELDAAEEQALHRRGHLTLHQTLGLSTLVAMSVTGLLGLARSNNWLTLPVEVHAIAGTVTTGLYLSTAGWALTAPPPVLTRRKQDGTFDTVDLHRNLAWLHAAGMLTTVGLGASNYFLPANDLVAAHGLAALATYALMGTSAGVIFFGH